MRNFCIVAVSLLGISLSPQAQQGVLSANAETKYFQVVRVKVYSPGNGVTAPMLLPVRSGPLDTRPCEKRLDGKIKLWFIADADGIPRNVMFLKPLGSVLDKFALQVVESDRFTPGMQGSSPVAVAESVEVEMKTCDRTGVNERGKAIDELSLIALPGQHFSPTKDPPSEAVIPSEKEIPKSQFDAEEKSRSHMKPSFPFLLHDPGIDAAPRFDMEGKDGLSVACSVSMIVDRHGIPGQMRVIESSNPTQNEKVLVYASNYRFKPALRDGEPVPVRIVVQVTMRLIKNKPATEQPQD